jgi:hypothetical protein
MLVGTLAALLTFVDKHANGEAGAAKQNGRPFQEDRSGTDGTFFPCCGGRI